MKKGGEIYLPCCDRKVKLKQQHDLIKCGKCIKTYSVEWRKDKGRVKRTFECFTSRCKNTVLIEFDFCSSCKDSQKERSNWKTINKGRIIATDNKEINNLLNDMQSSW